MKIGDKVRVRTRAFKKYGPGVLVNLLTDGSVHDHVVKFGKSSNRYAFTANELKKLMNCPEYMREL